MRPISRRDLLKGAAATGAVVASQLRLAGSASASPRRSTAGTGSTPVLRTADSLPFPGLPAGTDTVPQIEHIVVLMMENHSYDNYLGLLGRAKGQTPRGDGLTIGAGGRPTNTNPYFNGNLQRSFHMPSTCQTDVHVSQEWQASHHQFDGGKLQGFVTSPSGPAAMGYFTGEDLPFYYSLASTFPLADRWFCSVLGQTAPNRRYLTAATSNGMTDDQDALYAQTPPNGTIFDRLDHYGIGWRDYYHLSSGPTTGFWATDPVNNSPNLVTFEQFFVDCATGNLPGFCIVDPDYNTGSEENPQDIVTGEAFAARVVNAVLQSPSWPKTLFVWTYDEHGGWYDHVRPPAAVPPDDVAPIVVGNESKYDGFARYGFRVPAVVVSPFARRNCVSSVIHDHTSILAMVEHKWNLPALTRRDANANALFDFLSFERPGFPEPPLLAAPALTPAACEKTGPGVIPPPGSIIVEGGK